MKKFGTARTIMSGNTQEICITAEFPDIENTEKSGTGITLYHSRSYHIAHINRSNS